MIRLFITLITCISLSAYADPDLPSLGDGTSGIISLKQERLLGQRFLRSIRAGAPTLDDAILQDYLEHLIYRLAAHSQLEDRRLDLVLIKNPNLNAFAVPGGIVGVHHGLFFYGETEHEMSAILAHELAHLSQRHFARQLAAGKKSGAINLAGLLAGVLLAATAGGDAGLAAITGTQAYAQGQQLKYSRDRESEADRIGIHTLAEADMDPRAMAYMFERLERSSRYSTGNNIPEFLRTHPVTKNRISDSYNQTRNFPNKTFDTSVDYQLMRARARAITTTNPSEEAKRFSSKMNTGSGITKLANQYGLVLTLTQDLKFDEARKHVGQLRDQHPLNIPFRIAEAEIYESAQQADIAVELMEESLDFSPNNFPLTVNIAETYMAARKPHAALAVLQPLSVDRPNDEYVWYLLAEAYGLASNIPGVHEARAEFFVLNGNFDQAIKQLGYALPLVRHNFQQSERIKQRLEDIWELKGT